MQRARRYAVPPQRDLLHDMLNGLHEPRASLDLEGGEAAV
jgi:hypothetical protein